ncbi:M64 family metallopeptidase [Hymenobacter volaticus]|uniref:M64 family metallo-endopeptidase n=1 Tax=Hymenobacter volaticus TaxID=2932254 RepID=A0ABY4GBM2_9BACT|nr:M64 family metallopeptidase [Hymenobacter volaticus]UOQ67839.1 M64 family metallo-endopeptidase [Hymenobacter volaticus]
MKVYSVWLLLMLCAGLSVPVAAQPFPVDTLVKTGSLTKRINLVFVPDGYKEAEMPLFVSRAKQALHSMLAQSPFQEYQQYFNAFAIKVPSVESGSTHPRMAPDCGATPAFAASTYFNSTFDVGSIHRLLVPQRTAALGMVLAQSFPTYDQVFVLVNSSEYGGSGGQFATFSANNNASEIAIHEIGHSFAGLSDEYWAGSQYARETANMTQTTDPAKVRWAPWMGTNAVGIYPHVDHPEWQKPHQSCKMQFLDMPFCSVCKEAFVERIHTLVSPLQACSPTTFTISNPSQDLSFALTLLPPNPNTLKVTWTRDGKVFARDTAATTVALAQVPSGMHTVRAVVVDTTGLTRQASHVIQHSYTVDWTITRTVAGVSMTSATAVYEVETYPNPVSDVLTLNYQLPRVAPVTVTVYDAAGRKVKTIRYNRQAAGRYQYQLRSEELGISQAGIYTLLLDVDGIPITRQLVKQ